MILLLLAQECFSPCEWQGVFTSFLKSSFEAPLCCLLALSLWMNGNTCHMSWMRVQLFLEMCKSFSGSQSPDCNRCGISTAMLLGKQPRPLTRKYHCHTVGLTFHFLTQDWSNIWTQFLIHGKETVCPNLLLVLPSFYLSASRQREEYSHQFSEQTHVKQIHLHQ